jgi:DNA-binding Lrp family transcriptional regulator
MRDRILIALQRGVPLCARPFEALARDVGCTEDAVFAVLAACRAEGTVRRFGGFYVLESMFRSAERLTLPASAK